MAVREAAPDPVLAASPSGAPRPTGGILVAAAGLAGLVAASLAALSATQALTLLGLPDPGALTTYGLPFVTAVGEVAAVLAIGFLLLAAFLVPPQRTGVLDVDGYRAVRTASTAAAVWCVCAVLMIPLSLSDTSGQPLADALDPAAITSSTTASNSTFPLASNSTLSAFLSNCSAASVENTWTYERYRASKL